MFSLKVLTGGLLGWSLGTNDAANIFGTAVSSQMVRWKTAVTLIAIFTTIGAVIGGSEGLETYSKLSNQTLDTASTICLAAALAVTAMTLLRLPVSTSQAVVGAIIGVSLAQNGIFEWSKLYKVVLCWVGTPVGAAILSMIFYPLLARLIRRLNLHFFTYDYLMRTLLIIAGIYGAYALGANNVANVTGVFYKAGAFGKVGLENSKFAALLFGGITISAGAVTFSKTIMMSVGKSIVKLDSFSAFIAVLSEAVVVHIYSLIGVPVSTSQAVVGAIPGIGIIKGMKTVSFSSLFKIMIGWIMTPIVGLVIAYTLLGI